MWAEPSQVKIAYLLNDDAAKTVANEDDRSWLVVLLARSTPELKDLSPNQFPRPNFFQFF